MVHTVIVSLRVKPGMVDAFLEVMGENSRASRRDAKNSPADQAA